MDTYDTYGFVWIHIDKNVDFPMGLWARPMGPRMAAGSLAMGRGNDPGPGTGPGPWPWAGAKTQGPWARAPPPSLGVLYSCPLSLSSIPVLYSCPVLVLYSCPVFLSSIRVLCSCPLLLSFIPVLYSCPPLSSCILCLASLVLW